MKLTFIGVGGAFAPMSVGQSNMLFTSDSGKNMLLDCGMTAPYILQEMGIKAQDIDAVYISHLHADHIGGMEWLGFMNYFTKAKRPTLFGAEPVLHSLWSNSLRGGMECIQGQMTELSTFFNVGPVKQNGFFLWEEYRFIPVQTLHVLAGFYFQHSYGLMIQKVDYKGPRTFITTDTQFSHPCPLQAFYDQADIIFHDCENGPYKSGVHAHYDDMKEQLSTSTKEKIWLYHHNKETETVKEDGFAGFCKKGQVFEI